MHILIVLIVVACLHSDKKGKCYIERVKMVAENKYRVDSGMNAQKVPEFIQAMKDRGHHLDIKLKSMEEMKDSVAELFNAEMERRRGEDATLPIFDISGQEVMSFVGDGGLPHYCDDWHVIFKNYAPIIPARVGVDEPMFNPNFASDYAHSHSCKQLGGYYIVGYPDCDRRIWRGTLVPAHTHPNDQANPNLLKLPEARVTIVLSEVSPGIQFATVHTQ